uniref:Uncharacterized protein n=1 Tax=Pseudomonas phage HRDY3 TaxID=3236930 RepID=A0AB39CEQ6_9VIRU
MIFLDEKKKQYVKITSHRTGGYGFSAGFTNQKPVGLDATREGLIAVRDRINELLEIEDGPVAKSKSVRKKPVAYATVQDLESVDASIVRIAVMLGLQPAEIAQAMRTTTSQVRLALELKNTRPKNPPGKD